MHIALLFGCQNFICRFTPCWTVGICVSQLVMFDSTDCPPDFSASSSGIRDFYISVLICTSLPPDKRQMVLCSDCPLPLQFSPILPKNPAAHSPWISLWLAWLLQLEVPPIPHEVCCPHEGCTQLSAVPAEKHPFAHRTARWRHILPTTPTSQVSGSQSMLSKLLEGDRKHNGFKLRIQK